VNFRSVYRFLGRLLLLLAAGELVPTACAIFYREWSDATAFVLSAICTAVCGLLLSHLGRKGDDLYRREGILIVVGGWILASLFGALPYILSGAIPHPIDALFESASGFTTTGASVMLNIEAA
jgi:trk system potassium uptake protein TrkH